MINLTEQINNLIRLCADLNVAVIVSIKEPGLEPVVAGCGHTYDLVALGAYSADYGRNKMRVAKVEETK